MYGSPRKRRPEPASGHGPGVREVLDAIRRLVRALRLTARAAESQFGLSGAQLFVLKTLAEEGAFSVNELAERTSTDQSSVSVVVRRLVERGLVSRTADPQDARRRRLTLTPKGRAIVRRAPRLAQASLLEAIEALPLPERVALAARLEAINERMGVGGTRARMLFDEESGGLD